MKTSPRTIRRPNDVPRDEVVIPLPEARLLRLIARSFLLFAVVLSLPWLRSALISDSSSAEIGSNSAKDDELFYMPKLVQDMKAYGLIQPEKRSLFVGNPGTHASLLRLNGISCLPERNIPRVGGPQSLDFVFLVAAAGGFNDAYFRLMDSTIKVGGVAAFRLGTHPVKPFNLPANYRMIYIQNIGRTIIAVKKLYHDSAPHGRRRLLLVPKVMEFALQALEDALLEPPVGKKQRKRVRYLPELIGGCLDEYPRRVFVDIGSPGRVGAEAWFRHKYPGNKEFEIVRVDLVDFPAWTAGGSGDVGEWLTRNVRKEEYVVVKAEAEAVEAMSEGEVIELVDELFLECGNEWEDGEVEEEGKWRKRAYWECLALFGKLRESGVAVHQWWG